MNTAKEYTCWLSSGIMLATDLSKPATSSSSATPASAKHPHAVQAPLVHGSGCMHYHEQGVNKLLQLKLLQVVLTVDVPPPGLMIVLVTGDSNVSQFNKKGFCYVPGHLAHIFFLFLVHYVLIQSHDLDSHDRLPVQQSHLVGNSIVPSFCTFSIVLFLW